ncbi:MAG: ABC transporter ATP-binding protein, partial [Clostridia bacterium]
FVEQMPKGYDSLLASAGVNLSGGQKQRLSIARGFLKNAPILLLDDATSALDSITETKVRTALTTLAKEHTVITVTQRCTTAMYADHILVLENGERVGFGTHRELLESCEIYREIYHSQVDSGKEATLRA